jgi:hypothetical protein
MMMKLSTLHYQRDHIVTLYGPGFPDEGDQWVVDLTNYEFCQAANHAYSIRDNASGAEVVMDIDLPSLVRDMRNTPGDTMAYYDLVIGAVWAEEVSITQLYHGDVYDIPLYLTLHAMVMRGEIEGLSPYDTRARDLNHDGLIYYREWLYEDHFSYKYDQPYDDDLYYSDLITAQETAYYGPPPF